MADETSPADEHFKKDTEILLETISWMQIFMLEKGLMKADEAHEMLAAIEEVARTGRRLPETLQRLERAMWDAQRHMGFSSDRPN